jgi:hypothetical protein
MMAQFGDLAAEVNAGFPRQTFVIRNATRQMKTITDDK